MKINWFLSASAGSLLLVSSFLPGAASARHAYAAAAKPDMAVTANVVSHKGVALAATFQKAQKCRLVAYRDCSQAQHPKQCKTKLKRVCSG